MATKVQRIKAPAAILQLHIELRGTKPKAGKSAGAPSWPVTRLAPAVPICQAGPTGKRTGADGWLVTNRLGFGPAWQDEQYQRWLDGVG